MRALTLLWCATILAPLAVAHAGEGVIQHEAGTLLVGNAFIGPRTGMDLAPREFACGAGGVEWSCVTLNRPATDELLRVQTGLTGSVSIQFFAADGSPISPYQGCLTVGRGIAYCELPEGTALLGVDGFEGVMIDWTLDVGYFVG